MDYKIIFSLTAYLKLTNYVEKCSTEISGFGKIKKYKEEGYFYIEDIVLLPQKEATGVLTTFNNADFYDDIIQQGEQPSDYRCWWHSHVWMPVQWSSKDIATINDWDIEKPVDNWFISIVANKKKEFRCRVDIWDPLRLTFDDVPWEIDFSNHEIEQRIETDIQNMVDPKYFLPFDKTKNFWLNLSENLNIPQRDIIIPADLNIE